MVVDVASGRTYAASIDTSKKIPVAARELNMIRRSRELPEAECAWTRKAGFSRRRGPVPDLNPVGTVYR